jgi:hypothetical protein
MPLTGTKVIDLTRVLSGMKISPSIEPHSRQGWSAHQIQATHPWSVVLGHDGSDMAII